MKLHSFIFLRAGWMGQTYWAFRILQGTSTVYIVLLFTVAFPLEVHPWICA